MATNASSAYVNCFLSNFEFDHLPRQLRTSLMCDAYDVTHVPGGIAFLFSPEDHRSLAAQIAKFDPNYDLKITKS